MVKYTDIHKAIVNKLNSKFPNIEVTSTDVSEGFKRPSFFVNFDNVKVIDFMSNSQEKELTVKIYYFSKDREKNKYELLTIQDDLKQLFLGDILQIDEDTNVEIEELEFDVIDKVLYCYFDVKVWEDYDRVDNIPNMEDLDYEVK